MISINTNLYEIDGDFLFYDKDLIVSDLTDMNVKRRVSKVKTLDGGVYIDDSGYAPGDTDINISVRNIELSIYNNLKDVFKYHSVVIISSFAGVFLCTPFSLRLKNGNAIMIFSTKENV